MREDVEALRQAGAQGVVLGFLDADGPSQSGRPLAPLPVTFHRAIDVAADPVEATRACVRCGVARILSSGGAASAEEGAETLRRMVDAAAGQLVIAAGAGITEANAAAVLRASGVNELHGSLRGVRPSAMRFRPSVAIPMGAEKRNGPTTEFELRIVDADRVAALVASLRCSA
eukprot:TRINITY_DN25820_c0_g1_i2.p1 TRINITY_DN25820_c0_g1~~TRINITY_DN25820_c0_g1_i2.p1  ORF type:complete len:173 (-),score=49.29 TRINITY_DN25820_c0_g1_i2:146-664(-)